MNKIFNYPFSIYIPLFVLFFVLVLNSAPPLAWGYDEFGTIVSHLELDNPDFNNIYRGYFVELGITNPVALDFIVNYILPLFIVPVRWTYALGISPIIGFSRFVDLEWPILGFVLLVPYIFFAILGAYLVALSITKNGGHQNIFLFFLSFVLLSHPFLKWTLTLTSYSHHLFCFGLLLYSETQFKETNNIFSKLTFSRSIVQLFNYQYIVIFAAIGLYQVIINFKIFFKNKIYMNWILPFSIALASIGFLYLRGLVSGKHTNPAYATNVEIYNFSGNTNSFISSVHYTITRLIDFLYYFFIESKSFYGGPNDISTSFIGSFIFILIIISIYLIILKKINKNIKRILLLLLFSLLAPYLLSFQPFVATRHSLVLFLPVALIFSFTASILLESFLKKKYVMLGSFLLLLFSAYNAVGFNTSKSVNLNIEKITPILSQYSINQIILSPCDYEPLLFNDIRNVFKVLYRCGPKIVNKVGPSEERIAILSKKDISVSDARKIISDFSVNDWVLTGDFINCNIKMVDKDLCMSSVHIFNKVIKSD
jgi:hypothetical protein